MVLGLVQQSLNTRLSEAPGTSIEGLLLSPDNGLGIGVLVKVLPELLPRERVKLLDAGNSDVVNLIVATVLLQSSVNLARAENDTLNLIVALDGAGLVSRIRNDPVELGITNEILNIGAGNRMTQEGF